ncbi:MAG: endonuclease domain-containing protein [Clostridia bacterium]|nr:endonuclease domain-containing protein [Clostridia bacterium]
MKNLSNSRLTPNSRLLRKGMTKEERRLWYDFLKKLPLTVNRQKVIGNYIVDFFCFSAKIVIELDGSQHYSEKGAASDRLRDEFLGSEGIRVLRYSNHDVNTNFDGVCADILKHLELTWDDFCGSAAKTDES